MFFVLFVFGQLSAYKRTLCSELWFSLYYS